MEKHRSIEQKTSTTLKSPTPEESILDEDRLKNLKVTFKAGFSQIPNFVIQCMYEEKLSISAMKVFLVILRNTYGRRDKKNQFNIYKDISYSYFAAIITQIDPSRVSKGINELEKKGFISITRVKTKGFSRINRYTLTKKSLEHKTVRRQDHSCAIGVIDINFYKNYVTRFHNDFLFSILHNPLSKSELKLALACYRLTSIFDSKEESKETEIKIRLLREFTGLSLKPEHIEKNIEAINSTGVIKLNKTSKSSISVVLPKQNQNFLNFTKNEKNQKFETPKPRSEAGPINFKTNKENFAKGRLMKKKGRTKEEIERVANFLSENGAVHDGSKVNYVYSYLEVENTFETVETYINNLEQLKEDAKSPQKNQTKTEFQTANMPTQTSSKKENLNIDKENFVDKYISVLTVEEKKALRPDMGDNLEVLGDSVNSSARQKIDRSLFRESLILAIAKHELSEEVLQKRLLSLGNYVKTPEHETSTSGRDCKSDSSFFNDLGSLKERLAV